MIEDFSIITVHGNYEAYVENFVKILDFGIKSQYNIIVRREISLRRAAQSALLWAFARQRNNYGGRN